MKIISKHKDYYDHIPNIYGVDDLVILDRREFTTPTIFECDNGSIIKIYVGGYLVEGFIYNKQFHYGKELLKFGSSPNKKSYKWYDYRQYSSNKSYMTRYGNKDFNIDNLIIINEKFRKRFSRDNYLISVPIKDDLKVNEIENCPIVVIIGDYDRYYPGKYTIFRNSILKNINFNSIVEPYTVYTWIYDWISLQNTNKENMTDLRTSIEKLKSKGFDEFKSFRPNMK